MLVGCEGSSFFFQTVVGQLHSHFEVIFGEGHEEAEEDAEDQTGSEAAQSSNQGDGDVFRQFGMVPLILRVCEYARTDFDSVMSWSVCQTFFIASYIITKNRYEQQQIKQMQMRHR